MVTSLSMGMRRYESSKNWNDLGELFKDYAMNKDGFLSSMVSDTTEYLIENCKTEFEKVDKIVSYIQKNIEVDPTFTDKSFKNILNNKKGDVLSINGLAQSMLSKAGFKAEFLLIHTASEGYFDKDYINKNQFTMPAIRTYIDDKEYILFPYLKYLPVGLLPNDVQGQTVLVISNDANAVLDKIGSANVEDDKYHESYNLKITEDGNIKVTEEKSIDGLLAYYMRKKILDLNSDEKEKFVKNIISYNEGDVKFEDFKILNEKDYKKPLIIKSDYAIDNLITITPEEIILQTAGLFTPSPMENKKFKNEKRKNPIKIYNNLDYTKDISINYPDNWKVQSDLKDVDYKNTFGEVKSHFEISDGNLKASQQQYLHRTSQQKDKFDELKEILGSNSKITIPAIVFANKSNLN